MKSAGAAAAGSWWRRRVVDPIGRQLTLGVTPDRLAFTLGVGTACSLLPFVGFTTLLNLVVGFVFRLNQPVLQVLNQVLGPLQLLLILPYVRLGEVLWGASGERFAVEEMLLFFREASWGAFLERFGWAGIHALTAWTLTAPALVAVVFWPVRPGLRRLAASLSPASGAGVRT